MAFTFFGLFKKEETAQQIIENSKAQMKQRVMEGVRANQTIEDIYQTEMQHLWQLQSDIVTPPSNIWKKDKYRKKYTQVLKGVITECKNYFVTDMDDQLQLADEFVKTVDKDTNIDAEKQARKEFFRQAEETARNARSVQGEEQTKEGQVKQGIQGLLKNQNGNLNLVGTPNNLGAFQTFHKVKALIDEEKEKFPIDDIHELIRTDMKSEFTNILKGTTEGEEYTDYNKLCVAYKSLKNAMDNYVEGDRIKELMKEFRLDRDEGSVISDILQDASVEGATGLDFMVCKHSALLADVVIYKLLRKLDEAALKIAKDKGDVSVLDTKGYVELYSREKALSYALSEFALSKEILTQEFQDFKEERIREIKKENEEYPEKEREAHVAELMKDLFDESSVGFPDNLLKISTRLKKYSKFFTSNEGLSGFTPEKSDYSVQYSIGKEGQYRLVKAYYLLKNPSEYVVDLKEMKDFSYLVYSVLKCNLRKVQHKVIFHSISGMGYMIRNYPDLFDQLTAYALISQLEKEVNKVGKDNIPGFNNNKYDALMELKQKGIDINKCEESIKNVRKEYDKDLQRWSKYNLEYYANYQQWNDLVIVKNNKGDVDISDEDLFAHDTNDIDKLESLTKKYGDDVTLREYVNYRKERIQYINKVEEQGPDPEILKNKKLNVVSDNIYCLEGISHEQQNTPQGCWSEVLAEMLNYKGLKGLDQRTIRSYRSLPAYNESAKKYEASYIQNMGGASNIGVHMNLIAKVLPNAALHKVEIQSNKIPKDKLVDSLKDKINKVVKESATPLGISYDGHYRLICGLSDNCALILDPQKNEMQNVDLGSIFAKRGAVELYWLTDIDIKDGKAGVQIDRTKNPDYKDIIQYDENGNLQDLRCDDGKEPCDVNEYVKNLKPEEIPLFQVRDGFVHENYGVYASGGNGDNEAEIIYLPKKLKLNGNPH